jgi:hypothetical protein
MPSTDRWISCSREAPWKFGNSPRIRGHLLLQPADAYGGRKTGTRVDWIPNLTTIFVKFVLVIRFILAVEEKKKNDV